MRKIIVYLILTVLCFHICKVEAVDYIDFFDGQVHEIDSTISNSFEIVRVDYGYTGVGTTLNIVPGGKIGLDCLAFENSKVNLLGGEIASNLFAQNNSQITVSDGVVGEFLWSSGNSQVTISGGHIGIEVDAYMNSQITFSGGTIGHDLRADGYSQVTISGGQVGYELWATQHGVVTIYGSDFSIDGLNIGYGPITVASGILTGTLASGDLIDTNFHIYDEATITLIPEPATFLLLALGSLALLRKRRG
jgi:hypothetical protein